MPSSSSLLKAHQLYTWSAGRTAEEQPVALLLEATAVFWSLYNGQECGNSWASA